MPNYNTFPVPTALYRGDTATVFNAEQPAVPQASERVAIGLAPSEGGNGSNLSIELQFSAAPGVFEVDLQTADTDTDQAYENYPGAAGVITVVDANFRCRAELVNLVCKFARLLLKSRANAVNLTAKISR